ncbi:hypothetical protein NEOLEDRAFT_1149499 [Neolentinus lepideus HHB14362 ss-1]|uniref:Uncharacterized protein n=1 Tax=Neolentinus lepideus HHB14362 ss-1 TaxID=1314782 RepID=A0A165R2F0_9AGAM|nr:hypothetical protein NEOLEDRAFT_1149499 [Neolentinus lepideus HHB14362 ss-1]
MMRKTGHSASTAESDDPEESTHAAALGKRKESCEDEDDSWDLLDDSASWAAESAQEFWAKLLKQTSNTPVVLPRCPCPTYSGVGRTSVYMKQRALCEAAQGSAKLDTYFNKTPRANRAPTLEPSPESLAPDPEGRAASSDLPVNVVNESLSAMNAERCLDGNSPTSTCGDPPVVPDLVPSNDGNEHGQPIQAAPEITQVPQCEPELLETEFLDPMAEEEDVPEDEDVLQTVKKLMVEAKKFWSFHSLMQLHSVKQFIELQEKYKKNP